MVSLSRCLGALALFTSADGARVDRKRLTEAQKTKFIAGVPVLEYHMAYGGSEAALVDTGNTQQEWIVFVQPGTTDAQVKEICGRNKNGCNIVGHPVGGAPFVEMRATEADLEHLIKSSGGVVQFIEPDQEESLIPDMEADMEASTWGLNRIGADSRGRTGSGTTIYVQDTGVRVSHVEFEGRAASALDVTSGDAVECNGDVNCAADRQSHGTHCAGTTAGRTYGVASTAAVRAVKTLSDQGSGARSWQYTAIDWVTVNGVRPAVISMSLGGNGADPGYTTVIDAAVNAGVVVVVAAGNSNSDACNFSPAFADNAITVGSTTSTDARSSFSNYGRCVNIWAPGSNVLSAGISSDTSSSTKSGTSMACPHVSGAAAIVLSGNPTMKSSAVLREMLDTAYLNVLTGLKTGDTNALLCVAEGGAPPTPTPAPTPAPPPGSWVIEGSGCEMSGNCISSNNHPSNYGNSQECTINLYGSIDISVDAFNTESRYDWLTVGGSRYSGTTGPSSGTYTGTISWETDSSVTRAGWKLCKA